jgi:hypothetical protein
VSRAVLKGEEHTEKASESPPSKPSIVSRVRIEEEEKGRTRVQVLRQVTKISISLIRIKFSYISNLLTYLGIEEAILRLITSPKGPRLRLFDY